ncbi:MAG: alpha/beta fold hydrolase [Rhizobiales bacterium]|nr:alpha/beta fold hydrolase [Hyphomicrobiales bacterium]
MAGTNLVLVPGLLCTAELYRDQIAGLADIADATVADHSQGETMMEIARAILAKAPPTFALCGLSMGGYVAFEIMRQAPDRVERLALLDTAASADTSEQKAARRARMARAERGELIDVALEMWPLFVHPTRVGDEALKARFLKMARDTGAERFVRQQRAIMSRPDSTPFLSAISQQTLVVVGDADRATPPERAQAIVDGVAFSELATIAVCGHLSTMERPEAVNAALRRWLTPGV